MHTSRLTVRQASRRPGRAAARPAHGGPSTRDFATRSATGGRRPAVTTARRVGCRRKPASLPSPYDGPERTQQCRAPCHLPRAARVWRRRPMRGTRGHPMDGARLLPRGIGTRRCGRSCRPEPGRRPHRHRHLVRAGRRRRPGTRPFRRVGARARHTRRGRPGDRRPLVGDDARRGDRPQPDGALPWPRRVQPPEARLRGCSDPARGRRPGGRAGRAGLDPGRAESTHGAARAARRPRRRAHAGRGCGPPSGTPHPRIFVEAPEPPSPGRRGTGHASGRTPPPRSPSAPSTRLRCGTSRRRSCTAGAARRWCTARGDSSARQPRPSGTAGIWWAPCSASLPRDRRRDRRSAGKA